MDANKKEMLAKAKVALGDKKPDGNPYILEGKTDESITIMDTDLPEKAVLTLSKNTGCTFTVAAGGKGVLKILMNDCKGCSLILLEGSKVTTSCIEVWDCKDVTLNFAIKVGTLQIDLCTRVSLVYSSAEMLGQAVQAGCHDMTIIFTAEPHFNLETGVEQLKSTIAPHLSSDDRATQFNTRVIDGKPLTEEVIRLSNDFPTTQREKAIHDANLLKKEHALREMAENMLSGVGSKLGGGEAAEIQAKLDRDVAKLQMEQDTPTGDAARAAYKREMGTEQFKIKEYRQAAVHYTESINLDDTVAAVWCNRAMCWLKLADTTRCISDCDRCLTLEPNNVKALFRKGVALVEQGTDAKAGEARPLFIDACKCFRLVLEIDPRNAPAKSSMALAEKKMSMLRD